MKAGGIIGITFGVVLVIGAVMYCKYRGSNYEKMKEKVEKTKEKVKKTKEEVKELLEEIPEYLQTVFERFKDGPHPAYDALVERFGKFKDKIHHLRAWIEIFRFLIEDIGKGILCKYEELNPLKNYHGIDLVMGMGFMLQGCETVPLPEQLPGSEPLTEEEFLDIERYSKLGFAAYAETVEDFCKQTGFEPEDIIHKRLEVDVTKPVVWIVDKDDVAYVCARGTTELDDVITDIIATTVEFGQTQSMYGLEKSGEHIAIEARNVFEDKGFDPATKRVIFCGHSLGASTAGIAATIFKVKFEYQNIQFVGCGVPSCLGVTAQHDTRPYCYSIINHDDIVPRMGTKSFADLMIRAYRASRGKLFDMYEKRKDKLYALEDWVEEKVDEAPFFKKQIWKGIENFVETLMPKALERNSEKEKEIMDKLNDSEDFTYDELPVMIPFGRVFVFFPDEFEGKPKLMEVEPTYLTQIIMSKTLLDDHHTASYDSIFDAVRDQYTTKEYAFVK